MKNQTLLVTLMAIIALFAASCSKPQTISFTEFSKKGDTVIAVVVYHPTLKNRIGCNDTLIPTKFINGQPVGQKVVGWTMDTLSVPASVMVKVTAQDMKDHTIINPKAPAADENKTSSNSYGFWNGFSFCGLIPWLLLTALVVLIAWLLSRLPWFRDRNVTHTHVHTYPQQQAPPAPPIVKPEEDNKNISVPEYFKLSSDKKSETEEKIELKYRSGVPMDVLLGMKNRNESGIQVIVYNPGDGNITINVNGEKPVPPVQP